MLGILREIVKILGEEVRGHEYQVSVKLDPDNKEIKVSVVVDPDRLPDPQAQRLLPEVKPVKRKRTKKPPVQ